MTSRILKTASALAAFMGWCTFSAPAEGIQLVSVIDSAQGPPVGGGGDSYLPILSPDGRYVLFASTANNLVALEDGRPIPSRVPAPLNVFLRDRSNSTTVLISVDLAGTGGTDADATPVAISPDGRFALFESAADNLVAGDTNSGSDVFVRDLLLGKTILVSGAADGGAGNGPSQWSAMTPDGRYVAFVSAASNLVAGDTNGIPDVFVRDLDQGVTARVSEGAAGPIIVDALALENPPVITPDGRYVLFHSIATNLVAGVMTSDDLYVRDMFLSTTVQASAGARAAATNVLGKTDIVTFNYVISSNGQYVAYEAGASDGTAGLVLRYRVESGVTEVVCTNAAAASQGVGSVEMTPDGGAIAFVANADGNDGTTTCVLVWDAQTGTSVLASGDLTNGVSDGSLCFWPTVDLTGRYVAFLSGATGLVTNALPGEYHLFVRDLQARTTTLVDADANGMGSLLTSMPAPSLSADGRFVAFECPDGNLVANDRNRAYDVFVRDLVASSSELISAHDPSLPCLTPNGDSSLSDFPVSADGLKVAFWSESDNLVANDTNGFRDVFVRDLAANQTILVSIDTNGVPADGIATDAAISAEGRYVAFSSEADDLAAGDNNKNQDVFVRDLQTGVTTLVSVNKVGTGSGNGASDARGISSDGRYVLFHSDASDLLTGVGGNNLLLRDRQLGTNYALANNGLLASAMTRDGRFVAFAAPISSFSTTPFLCVWDSSSASLVYTNFLGYISGVAISPEGQRILYWGSGAAPGLYAVDRIANTNWALTTNRSASGYGPRFSADGQFVTYTAGTSATNQVYLYDFQTGTNLLVSQQWGSGAPGDGSSDSPDISADRRFVAYRSLATNLVPNDANGVPDIFLFDRVSGTTTLVSANRFGKGSADNRSLHPVFNGDGRTLFFVSFASDLVAGDYNNASDVFAYDVYSTQPAESFRAATSRDGTGWQIRWPALPGKSYRVQYKDNLSDPIWRELSGTLAIIGSTGYFADRTIASTQRFYRVVMN